MIIECPSCSSRFHLADGRVPQRGARVRCSRCQHRFFVTPAGQVGDPPTSGGGDKSRPKIERGPLREDLTSAGFEEHGPGKARKLSDEGTSPTQDLERSGARAKGRGGAPATGDASQRGSSQKGSAARDATGGESSKSKEKTKPAAPEPRPAASGAPKREDPDLENPEFLFEDELPNAGQSPSATPAASPPPSPSTTQGKSQGHGQSQRKTQRGAEKAGADKSEKAEQWVDHGAGLANKTGGKHSVRTTPDPDPAPRSPTRPTADADAMAASLRATERESHEIGMSEPGDVSAHAERESEPDFSARADVFDASPAEPAPRAPVASAPQEFVSRTPAPAGDPFSLTDADVFGDEPPEPAAAPRATAAAVRSVAAPAEDAPTRAPRDSVLFERLSQGVAAVLGLLLVVSGARALLRNDARASQGPTEVHSGGWEIRDVEVLRLRDSDGNRVLAVRGRLSANGAAGSPAVRATLVGTEGKPVGAPIAARHPWLELASLSPQFLRTYGGAASSSDAPASTNGAASLPTPPAPSRDGFTILIPDPPDGVRRFRLEVAP